MRSHHRLAVSLLVLCALLALPWPVAAGGGAVVELTEELAEVRAGESVTIGFEVLRHGSAVTGMTPRLEAQHRETGERITIDATWDEAAGHYVAEITFPAEGSWKWSVSPDPYPATGLPSLTVLPAAGAALGAHPAILRPGGCVTTGDQPGATIDLEAVQFDAAAEEPAAVGMAPAPAVQRSVSTVDAALTDLIADAHSISIRNSAGVIACGDVGGFQIGDELLIGLIEQNDSGFAGIAELTPDGDQTTVTVYLGQGLTAPGSGSTVADAGTGATAKVEIVAGSFSVPSLEIKLGTTVTWTNLDPIAHTVDSQHLAFANSGALNEGESFTQTFTEAGTFDYYCGPHPYMTGTVVVTE